jgi:hypothetical protein
MNETQRDFKGLPARIESPPAQATHDVNSSTASLSSPKTVRTAGRRQALAVTQFHSQ